jgi:predicted acetyltransferase
MLRSLVSEDDFEQAAAVTGYAFNCDLKDHALRRDRMRKEWQKGNTLGWFDDGTLAAVLGIFPYRVYLYGRTIPMEGIGSVAALPEYRYGGLTARLIKEALARMDYNKTPISMLQPFSYDFYRKYGYEYAYDVPKVKVNPEVFSHLASKGDLRPAEEGDLPVLAALYDGFARRYNLAGVRDEKDWRGFAFKYNMKETRRGEGRRYCYIRKEQDGYLAFDPTGKDPNIEFVFATPEAAKGIAGFIGRHSEVYFRFESDFVLGNLFRTLAKEARDVEISLRPGMMVRVVHAKTLLALLPASTRGILNLDLRDELIESNNGVFGVSFAPETNTVSDQPIEGAPTLHLDIREFSRLVGGDKSAGHLYYNGLLPGDETAALLWDRLFPPRMVYANLHF